MSTHIPEPKVMQAQCSYCGDAPVNHTLSYLESFLAFTVDRRLSALSNHAPKFLKRFADWIPISIFKLLTKIGLAHFSSDIDKACSFRSRIIWEEAQRRGIHMEQLVIGKKPIDWYRTLQNGKYVFFESLPILPEFLDLAQNWDDKIILKKELALHNVPIPQYLEVPFFKQQSLEDIFNSFKKPVIIKPRIGSRARHTITNINTLQHFKEGLRIAGEISSHLVVEEHIHGHVCRATVVGGTLAGFYRGTSPFIIGDGVTTIRALIEEKDNARPNRVETVRVGDELRHTLSRAGYSIDDVLPEGTILPLSHRIGRLFGGTTKEMIDELHPSFIPIIEKAGKAVGLAVAGFDCIIPDPTKDAEGQRWGIIECNTLPFIDLHYYALEGKPRNIAGMIWDLWDNKN